MDETIGEYIRSLVSTDEEYNEILNHLFNEYEKYALKPDGSYSIEFEEWLANEDLH